MGLRLQARDLRIIKAIHDCVALQITHIHAMFFGSSSRAYDRMAKLLEYGYIDCVYVSQISTSPNSSQRVFVTSKLGAQVLVDNFGYDSGDIAFAGKQVYNWQHLKHLLSINDVRARMVVSCQDSERHELLTWRSEAFFRARKFTTQVDAQNKFVYPDGYCAVAIGQRTAHYFIEADNGTEGHTQFRQQIRVYEAYIRSRQCERDLGASNPHVLVVTTSQRRLKNLAQSIERVSSGSSYLLTTYKQLEGGDVFTQPIWVHTHLDEAVSLA